MKRLSIFSMALFVSGVARATTPTVTELKLINADTDQPLFTLQPGQVINFATLPTTRLNIQAVPLAGSLKSVRFKLDTNMSRVENGAPFASASDQAGNYYPWTPSLGSHRLVVTPYSLLNGTGVAGPARTLDFTVINAAVATLTLINAETAQPIVALSPTSVIDLSVLPTTQLSVEAKVNAGATVGSVKFELDGTGHVHVENDSPYGIAGASPGNFVAWTPTPGLHSLKVTPFTGRNATGVAGKPMTVTLDVRSANLPPPGAIAISPGTPIQPLVDANPVGSIFYLKRGTHRLQSIVPKDNTQFLGETGAVLNGSMILPSSEFVKEGAFWSWTAPANLRAGRQHGKCIRLAQCIAEGNCETPTDTSINPAEVSYARCSYNEDIFVNDARLWHAHAFAELKPRRYWIDYAPTSNPSVSYIKKVYLADDPKGKTIEMGLAPRAFAGAAVGVTIQNLTIEKYASPAQAGAIHGDQSSGWTVESNVVRRNHGVGMRVGSRAKVLKNKFVENGQLGVGGGGTGSLVKQNEIAHNAFGGYLDGWEAGGTKFANSSSLLVQCNYVHNNNGPGLWTDINNVNTEYDRNLVVDNSSMGIFHEISYAARIHNNIVKNNSKGRTAWLYGAQILSSSSSDVEIHDNHVEVSDVGGNGIGVIQQDRCECRQTTDVVACAATCKWVSRNNYVHDNVIVHKKGGRTGAAADFDPSSFWKPGNVRFVRNDYFVPNLGSYMWEWKSPKTWNALLALGVEVGGKAETNIAAHLDTTKPGVPQCQ